MSVYVLKCLDKGEKGFPILARVVKISYLYIINQSPLNPCNMFQPRPYGKAELALLYQPCSTPETAVKTLNRWIKGCPMLMAELASLNYNPKRRTFLRPEVEAIVRHLGEP